VEQGYRRYDLLSIKAIRRLILSRNIQPVAQLLSLIPFVTVIVTGLIGVGIGAKNFSVVFTWILWSVLLALILVPLMGRVWCFACPIVWPGELIQRRLWSRFGDPLSLNIRWPKALSNVWLQNIIFTFFAIWMVVLVTQPFITAIAVTTLVLVATAAFLIFPRRVFCRYLCPPSLFIGLFSTFSPIEVRVKDRSVCLIPPGKGGCHKECYVGSEKGYGCPWYEFPQNMDSNFNCGLCMECFKTCPKDNIALNIRPFLSELEANRKTRIDEAWRALIMVSLPVIYTAVLFGPWSWIKNWGNFLMVTSSVGYVHHIFYAILLIDITFGLAPGLHLLTSAASRLLSGAKGISVRRLFVDYAYAYIPLGLMLWVGFNFSLIMMEWSYIPVVMSDPFGAGWNLLGTTYTPWMPIDLPIPIAEAAFTMLGVALSLNIGHKILERTFDEKRQVVGAFIPYAAFTSLIAIVFLWFYI